MKRACTRSLVTWASLPERLLGEAGPGPSSELQAALSTLSKGHRCVQGRWLAGYGTDALTGSLGTVPHTASFSTAAVASQARGAEAEQRQKGLSQLVHSWEAVKAAANSPQDAMVAAQVLAALPASKLREEPVRLCALLHHIEAQALDQVYGNNGTQQLAAAAQKVLQLATSRGMVGALTGGMAASLLQHLGRLHAAGVPWAQGEPSSPRNSSMLQQLARCVTQDSSADVRDLWDAMLAFKDMGCRPDKAPVLLDLCAAAVTKLQITGKRGDAARAAATGAHSSMTGDSMYDLKTGEAGHGISDQQAAGAHQPQVEAPAAATPARQVNRERMLVHVAQLYGHAGVRDARLLQPLATVSKALLAEAGPGSGAEGQFGKAAGGVFVSRLACSLAALGLADLQLCSTLAARGQASLPHMMPAEKASLLNGMVGLLRNLQHRPQHTPRGAAGATAAEGMQGQGQGPRDEQEVEQALTPVSHLLRELDAGLASAMPTLSSPQLASILSSLDTPLETTARVPRTSHFADELPASAAAEHAARELHLRLVRQQLQPGDVAGVLAALRGAVSQQPRPKFHRVALQPYAQALLQDLVEHVGMQAQALPAAHMPKILEDVVALSKAVSSVQVQLKAKHTIQALLAALTQRLHALDPQALVRLAACASRERLPGLEALFDAICHRVLVEEQHLVRMGDGSYWSRFAQRTQAIVGGEGADAARGSPAGPSGAASAEVARSLGRSRRSSISSYSSHGEAAAATPLEAGAAGGSGPATARPCEIHFEAAKEGKRPEPMLDDRTTLYITGVPNTMSRESLMNAIKAVPGCEGRFDTLLLPYQRSSKRNPEWTGKRGYAFVNMVDREAVRALVKGMHGMKLSHKHITKTVAVQYAQAQGREALIASVVGGKVNLTTYDKFSLKPLPVYRPRPLPRKLAESGAEDGAEGPRALGVRKPSLQELMRRRERQEEEQRRRQLFAELEEELRAEDGDSTYTSSSDCTPEEPMRATQACDPHQLALLAQAFAQGGYHDDRFFAHVQRMAQHALGMLKADGSSRGGASDAPPDGWSGGSSGSSSSSSNGARGGGGGSSGRGFQGSNVGGAHSAAGAGHALKPHAALALVAALADAASNAARSQPQLPLREAAPWFDLPTLGALCKHSAGALCEQPQLLQEANLSQAMVGLGRLGAERVGQEANGLATAVGKLLMAHGDSLKQQTLADCAWGLLQLKQAPHRLFDALSSNILDAASAKGPRRSPPAQRHLDDSLDWGEQEFACQGSSPALQCQQQQQQQQSLQRVNPGSLARLVWACGRAANSSSGLWRVPELADVLANKVRMQLPLLTGPELVSVLWGLTAMQHSGGRLASAAIDKLAHAYDLTTSDLLTLEETLRLRHSLFGSQQAGWAAANTWAGNPRRLGLWGAAKAGQAMGSLEQDVESVRGEVEGVLAGAASSGSSSRALPSMPVFLQRLLLNAAHAAGIAVQGLESGSPASSTATTLGSLTAREHDRLAYLLKVLEQHAAEQAGAQAAPQAQSKGAAGQAGLLLGGTQPSAFGQGMQLHRDKLRVLVQTVSKHTASWQA